MKLILFFLINVPLGPKIGALPLLLSEAEILNGLMTVNVNKGCGPDGISPFGTKEVCKFS